MHLWPADINVKKFLQFFKMFEFFLLLVVVDYSNLSRNDHPWDRNIFQEIRKPKSKCKAMFYSSLE